jgi:hypothetical protein
MTISSLVPLLSAVALALLSFHSSTATASPIPAPHRANNAHNHGHGHGHGHVYNKKDATPYLDKMRPKNANLDQSNLRDARYLKNYNNNGKNDNKDKNAKNTPKPSPSPTIAPTGTPTGRPTRSPVSVPWINITNGTVVLMVSLFIYESENLDLGTRNLNRLPAAEILDGSNDELIEDVLSSMAAIICSSDKRLKILSVVEGIFFDYCNMLLVDNDDDYYLSQFQVLPDQNDLSSSHTYMVTDLTDSDTGFLDVEDRRVFVNTDGGGDYLHWTVWTVSYPIVQLGVEVNSTALTIEDAQTDSDRAFAVAVSSDHMDELLREKSDRILVTSLIGGEVINFIQAIEEFEESDAEPLEESPLEQAPKQGYVFWQPIRIVGFVMLGFLMIFVGLLMAVGHERYSYDVWDARDLSANDHTKNDTEEEVDLNIATCEGLDYVLQSGHQLRKESNNPLEASDTSPMDMGNTNSEIAGERPPSTLPSLLARGKKKLFMQKQRLQPQNVNGHSKNSNSEHVHIVVTPKHKSSDYYDGTLLPPADDSPEHSPEDLLNGFGDSLTGPPLPHIESQSKRKLSQMNIGRKKQNNEVSTPTRMERVRPNGDNEEYYAFISVDSKLGPK